MMTVSVPDWVILLVLLALILPPWIWGSLWVTNWAQRWIMQRYERQLAALEQRQEGDHAD